VSGPATTTLRDLALALSEDERRELLRKISRSLSLKNAEERPIYDRNMAETERHEIIATEIDRLSFWRRLRFLLRRIFTTKPHDQAFIEFRLAEMRRRIRAACPRMSPIEFHSMCAETAVATWELYKAAYPLIPMFLDLWRSGDYLQESIEFLLSQQIPAARNDLYDFTTVHELQDSFMKSELKADVRKLVVDRLNVYLEEIPDDLFGHLEEGVLPLYLMRPLCLLDYNRFFETFGFDPGIAPPEGEPPFKSAPTSAALPLVEGLFYSLHSALRLEKGFYVHRDLLERYLELKEGREAEEEKSEGGGAAIVDPAAPGGEERGSDGGASESEDGERRGLVNEICDQLAGLHAAANRLSARVPFAEIVRFYRKDPWHKIVAYMPRLRLRDFYQSYLRMRILSQLDERFPEVRAGAVSRMTEDLFGAAPTPFEYFRPAVLTAPATLGLPVFRHIRSASVLHNFLRQVYRPRLQEMARLMSRVLPVRQRDSSSELVTHVAGIERAMADLDDFDSSFAPDSDDGKAFFRVRYGVEKDITLHRSYRNIVQQKDREVRTIVDKAMGHLRGLRQVFATIQRALTDQLRQRYAEADTKVSAVDGLDGLLDYYSEKLDLLDKLMKQTIAMEEGY